MMGCFRLFCDRLVTKAKPEKLYKSRVCGLLKKAFCARFVPNALFQTKNCLPLQGRSKTKNEHIHQRSWWLSPCGHSPLFLAMRQTHNYDLPIAQDYFRLPVNGLVDGIRSCSPSSSSFSWFFTYSSIRFSFFPTVST